MQPRKIARPRTYIMYMFGTLYQAYISCYPQQWWEYKDKGNVTELRRDKIVITIKTEDFRKDWLEVN